MVDNELLNDFLKKGIAELESGNPSRAAVLFSQAVRINPNSEIGWLWLGKSCVDPEQKRYCLNRVLTMNPYNLEALQDLQLIDDSSTRSPSFLSANQAIESGSNLFSPSSPALMNENEQSNRSFSAAGTNLARPVSSQPIRENNKTKPEQDQNKKKGFIFSLLGIAIIAIIIMAGVMFLFMSGKISGFIPGNSLPTWTRAILPTHAATNRSLSTAESTTSPIATIAPAAKPTIIYTPVFEEGDCKFSKPEGVVVNCGFLTVPENRSNDHSGTIRLAVAIFHSKDPEPDADPVIFLQGGPGGEAIMTSVSAYSYLVEPFLGQRDFIAFDQRGTGLSKPTIDCNELNKAFNQNILGQIPASGLTMIFTNAFRSCHGMMVVSGTDPNDFNTDASSDDLKDLVTALKYPQVDLYAASYGTRLALVTMRKHPEILRSVVLDSVVPVESNFYYEDPIQYNSALKALFDGCAVDSKCSSAYPNLETDFWDLVAKLNAEPVEVTAPLLTGGRITETVTGSDLVGTLALGLLKSAWMIPTAPISVNQIKAGDYSTFIAMQSSLPLQFEGINIGVYISMMCHEHILAGTPEELQSVFDVQAEIGRPYNWIFLGNAKDVFNTCKVWGAVPPSATEKDPVISDVPSLILEGAYDPVTPPVYGKQVAKNLSHSFYVEFPNQGHTPMVGDDSGCASAMVVSFLEDPNHEPDQECLANLRTVDFVIPYNGDPPVDLIVQKGSGLTAKMPVKWDKYYDGFFLRDNSPLDITQIVITRTYFINSTILLNSLSSKLYAYEGFDAAPTMVDSRKANGLNWALYKTASYGRPVNLAVADTPQGDALIVLLFCHSDEHDALYQTVFLPIIDSVKPLP
jgi:pimeloyl-ACP methyl ester carboxylesterase